MPVMKEARAHWLTALYDKLRSEKSIIINGFKNIDWDSLQEHEQLRTISWKNRHSQCDSCNYFHTRGIHPLSSILNDKTVSKTFRSQLACTSTPIPGNVHIMFSFVEFKLCYEQLIVLMTTHYVSHS